jgi:hypothetical protein
MSTHVLNFELQLRLCPLAGTLIITLVSMNFSNEIHEPVYLESKMLQEVCGTIGLVRFCPTPSIDPNTYSRRLSPRRMLCCDLEDTFQLIDSKSSAIVPTVSPLDRVVHSVFTPLLLVIGVAKPLFNGAAPKAALLRRPCPRLRANRREAMAVVWRDERTNMRMNELL